MVSRYPIQHISLDIWKTLVAPRPSYGFLRSMLIAKHLEIEVEHAEELYKQCDRLVGINASPDSDALHRVIHMMIVAANTRRCGGQILDLRQEMEQLFIGHAPQVSLAVVDQMNRIAAMGITFSVTSNVGLMNGKILRRVLADQGLPLRFHTFDDEVGVSKPSPKIFQAVLDQLKSIQDNLTPESSSVLHIGDDQVCDSGAIALGMQCRIIEGVDDLLPVLKEIK